MKTTNQFIIRGHKYELDDKYLYWSNKDGWVDFDTATVFKKNELKKINFPIGATAITWVEFVELHNDKLFNYVSTQPLNR